MVSVEQAFRLSFIPVFLVALSVAVAGCGSSSKLTEDELQKLDANLRLLVQGKTPEGDLSSTVRSDGTTVYSVFIRATNPSRVREARIPINSTSGNVLTARLSVDEIRRAARLETVTRIESSGQAKPHPGE